MKKQKNEWMRIGKWIALVIFAIFFTLMLTQPDWTTNPETGAKTPGNWTKIIWIAPTTISAFAFIWLNFHALKKD